VQECHRQTWSCEDYERAEELRSEERRCGEAGEKKWVAVRVKRKEVQRRFLLATAGGTPGRAPVLQPGWFALAQEE
jgi:hypothetical protein